MSGEHDDPATEKLRQRIAREAARLVAEGQDAHRARLRATRRVAGRFVPEGELPAHDAILRQSVRPEIADPREGGAVRAGSGDRLDHIAELARTLAHVKQDPARHPEGEALEHALQVFQLVEAERPYDEELLTAALLHDIGKTVDRRDPVAAGLAAVGGLVTDRTKWFLEQLPAARQLHDGTLGARARKRLEASEDFEDLLVLEEAERKGRVRGSASPSLDECITMLRGLAAE